MSLTRTSLLGRAWCADFLTQRAAWSARSRFPSRRPKEQEVTAG
ncbi:MAG TPA: hypothetical protein VLJ88_05215 [Propionibacteriaceae bacterium]|nr:hypothetical protein [Propionibacteriaceae bacterium]